MMLDNYAAFLYCMPVDSMMALTLSHLLYLVGAGASCLLLDPPGFKWCFSFATVFNKLFGAQGSPSRGSLLYLLVLVFDSSYNFKIVYFHDESLTS